MLITVSLPRPDCSCLCSVKITETHFTLSEITRREFYGIYLAFIARKNSHLKVKYLKPLLHFRTSICEGENFTSIKLHILMHF